jgi:transcriptional regulator GlxA family with amidase domain
MTHSVGLYLYDQVEVLDFAGPFEVFSTAARMGARLQPDRPEPFRVFTIADAMRLVQARGSLMVRPHHTLTDHPLLDVLVVPGGIVTEELEREPVIAWIAEVARSARLIASVCTGAFLLGQAGLLTGQRVTTHWEDAADLQAMFPEASVQVGARWIDNGQVITAAGISAGIDMSLYLVARLEGEALAVRTAHQMEYDWRR